MKYKTKVQTTGGSLRTTIPKIISDLFELEQGNYIEWIVDTQTETITVKKIEE